MKAIIKRYHIELGFIPAPAATGDPQPFPDDVDTLLKEHVQDFHYQGSWHCVSYTVLTEEEQRMSNGRTEQGNEREEPPTPTA